MEVDKKFRDLQVFKEELEGYHGATKLWNIPDVTSSVLYQNLSSSIGISLDQTVSEVIKKIRTALCVESVYLQFIKFQQEFRSGNIITWALRLPENKRKELLRDYKTYELLQIAFSLPEHYFQINPKIFKKWDREHNRNVFAGAIDAMIIDPQKVPQDSLDALGIQLDPDCQNLKNVFKTMRSLKYFAGNEKKYTPTVNEYKWKFITLSSQSQMYQTDHHPTAWEKRKEDVSVQMAVYTNLFSLLRREGHILESLEEKKQQYTEIKHTLISLINQIDWKKKCYGASVKKQVDDIIQEIDAATSAKVMAQKVYHLYVVHGKHSEQDKKHLEAAIRQFTQRVSQIIGISSNIQLHALALEDALRQQQHDLEMFHAQVMSNISREPVISPLEYERFLFAFKNYYIHKLTKLQEPFRTFDAQIHRIFGTVDEMSNQDPKKVMERAEIIVSLQRRFLNAYILEHQYKEWLLSVKDIQKHASNSFDQALQNPYPAIYNMLFADIDEKRVAFSPDFSYQEITAFFAELKDMKLLEKKIERLLQHV